MSIDNTGGETPTNEVLEDKGGSNVDAVVAELQKQIDEAKALAAQKTDEARKANYKIEADEKFTKALGDVRNEFEAKIEGITKILGMQLAAKEAEVGELKDIVTAKQSQTPNLTTAPVAEPQLQTVDTAKQGKYDGMFGVTR